MLPPLGALNVSRLVYPTMCDSNDTPQLTEGNDVWSQAHNRLDERLLYDTWKRHRWRYLTLESVVPASDGYLYISGQ